LHIEAFILGVNSFPPAEAEKPTMENMLANIMVSNLFISIALYEIIIGGKLLVV
jgi:hypothetical protein